VHFCAELARFVSEMILHEHLNFVRTEKVVVID
jgi:hypothetical protein